METNSKKRSLGEGSPPPVLESPPHPGSGEKTRSRENSGPPAVFPQTVNEAVAIAAGKKGPGHSEEDEGKSTVRSNMLCYLYWLLVVLIMGLISFTVWLSIQLARRHSVAILAQSKIKI